MTSTICSNPSCSNIGKSKCSACSTVTYCSPECQKQHWPMHKAACKAAKASSPKKSAEKPTTVPVNATSGLSNDLQKLKAVTQKCFQSGDFKQVLIESDKALEIAKKLSGAAGLIECFQLELNMGSACMQMRDIANALKHTEEAITYAEKAMVQRPGHPQSIELFAMGLNNKSFQLLQLAIITKPPNNLLEEAMTSASTALEKAESIFPKNDPRLCKYLKAVAVCHERQEKHEDAERLFYKAYTIVSLKTGPTSADAQSLIDDLVNMLVRKGDLNAAEKYARLNVKSVTEKKSEEQDSLSLSDSLSRLAMVLKRAKNYNEAESLLIQALEIREEKLSRTNPLGIAHSLIHLAGVQDLMGKVDSELEARLMRALDIFNRIRGPNSPEVRDTLNLLRDVRSRRKTTDSSAPTAATGVRNSRVKPVVVEDDSDEEGLQCKVTNESKMTKTSSVPSSSSRSSHQASTSSASVEEDLRKLELAPGDAVGRMMHANTYFELSKYSHAEVLIGEAYAIFMKQNGPEHPTTRTARQNLMVARNNSLNQLWMQVVAEAVLEATEKGAGEEKEGKDMNVEVETNSALSAAEQSQVKEYAKMMSGGAKDSNNLTEQLLFKEKPSNPQSCAIQ